MLSYIYIPIIASLMIFTTPLAHSHSVHVTGFAHENTQNSVEYVRVTQRKVSASEAKSIAHKKIRNAEVIDISIKQGVYKVRMQKKNGQVVDVYVDAATGRVR